jgi:L-histidine Nalpha-methyltransferase
MAGLARAARRHRPPEAFSDPFAADLIAGLSATPKRLPPKYFYDETGSQLFEAITELPEYYPTRTEISILREQAGDIAKLIPDHSALIDFGSGSSRKARLLLSATPQVAAYVPVDISGEMLEQEAATTRREFPQLAVLPIVADFTEPFTLPEAIAGMRRTGMFPGSTIGNFEPHEAVAFLRHAARILGRDEMLIVGVDLEKDFDVLHAAYNDAAGVTAKFNLNLLTRINRELGADFNLAGFRHRAVYNRERHRIEMHLVSVVRQKVRVCGVCFEFRAGETIHTECSYKYSIESFGALVRGAGWVPVAVFTDPDKYFSIHVLTHKEQPASRPAL